MLVSFPEWSHSLGLRLLQQSVLTTTVTNYSRMQQQKTIGLDGSIISTSLSMSELSRSKYAERGFEAGDLFRELDVLSSSKASLTLRLES